MVPAFCDQVVAKQPVESFIGKRNLKISLDIAREKCTGIFYIVGSGGFQQMHEHMWQRFPRFGKLIFIIYDYLTMIVSYYLHVPEDIF